ncbi:hypothetical protein D3C73_1119260 [compost metagenome]
MRIALTGIGILDSSLHIYGSFIRSIIEDIGAIQRFGKIIGLKILANGFFHGSFIFFPVVGQLRKGAVHIFGVSGCVILAEAVFNSGSIALWKHGSRFSLFRCKQYRAVLQLGAFNFPYSIFADKGVQVLITLIRQVISSLAH